MLGVYVMGHIWVRRSQGRPIMCGLPAGTLPINPLNSEFNAPVPSREIQEKGTSVLTGKQTMETHI